MLCVLALIFYDNLAKIQKFSPLYVDIFYHNSTLEAHGAKHKIRYPFEYFSKISKGGYWYVKKNGKKIYISKDQCVTTDYLDESFGDQKVVCSYCDKCINETMKERRDKCVMKRLKT